MSTDNIKLQSLTTKIKVYGVIIIAIGSILLSIIFISNYISSQKNDELNSIDLQINEADHKYLKQEQRILELAKAKDIWQKIEHLKNHSNNLDFDKVRTIINTLNEDRWMVKKIDINLSPPVDINFDGFKQVTLAKSRVDISFATISDTTMFSIINRINNNFPGFINYTMLKITRNGEVTKDTIDKISKGILPELVQCQMSFDWQNLKDLKNDK